MIGNQKKKNTFQNYFYNKYLSNLYSYPAKTKTDYVVNMKNLHVSFKNKAEIVHAVRGVSLKIKKGEIVGIVGESGSGKSVTVKSLIGFNGKCHTKSEILDFQDIDLSQIKYERNWKYLRGSRIAYIPQDPLLSLNPTKKIEYQIAEAIKISRKRKYQNALLKIKNKNISIDEKKELKAELKKSYLNSIKKEAISEELFRVLDYIGIKDIEEKIKCYPHEFSGGMRQRIVIAMAIVSEPDLIIADEPTTALDVTIQAKVLDLIKKLRNELNITIILISHNIGLVSNFCDFIYVMYAGKIVEQGLVKEIFTNPRHPYTWALISSIPDSKSSNELESIPGTPPNLIIPPIGDAFAARNKYALKIDFEQQPPMFQVGNSESHKAATWLLHESSPMKNIPDDILNKIAFAKKSIEIKEKILSGELPKEKENEEIDIDSVYQEDKKPQFTKPIPIVIKNKKEKNSKKETKTKKTKAKKSSPSKKSKKTKSNKK